MNRSRPRNCDGCGHPNAIPISTNQTDVTLDHRPGTVGDLHIPEEVGRRFRNEVGH